LCAGAANAQVSIFGKDPKFAVMLKSVDSKCKSLTDPYDFPRSKVGIWLQICASRRASSVCFGLSELAQTEWLGALIRASKKARILAAKTRTEFVVIRDGKLVREIPEIKENEAEYRPNGEDKQ